MHLLYISIKNGYKSYLSVDIVEFVVLVNEIVARKFEQLYDSRSMVAIQLILFATHVDSLLSHRTLLVHLSLAMNDHSTQSLHRLFNYCRVYFHKWKQNCLKKEQKKNVNENYVVTVVT